jgi:hypothetical protein
MTTATLEKPTIPRIALQSLAGGLALMAFFTCMWAWWAFAGLTPVLGITVAVIYSALSAIFVIEAIRLLVAARVFPTDVPDGVDIPDHADAPGRGGSSGSISRPRENTRTWFGIVFGAEGVAIFAVCAILGATGHTDYINPAIALIVGLHFIPLAWVFQRTIDFYVAGWFTLAATAGIVAIASGLMPVALVWSLVSIAAAAGTSFYGFYMIGAKRAMLATV